MASNSACYNRGKQCETKQQLMKSAVDKMQKNNRILFEKKKQKKKHVCSSSAAVATDVSCCTEPHVL